VKLNPGAFNRLLGGAGGLGQAVTWRRASLCPCRNAYSGAAEQGCPLCAGKGSLWAVPIPAWTGLAGMRATREWQAFGEFKGGDVVFTIPSDSPLYAAGETDRVVMTQSSEAFDQVLTRGAGDQLRFPVQEVTECFWRDPTTKARVDGAAPKVAADGTLTWTSGAPPAGTQYSISGRRRPEYYVFRDLVQDRAHHFGRALPRKVVMRRFELFGD